MAATTALPALPQNVSIFSPLKPEASQSLLNGRIFTKLAASALTTPSQLQTALSQITPASDRETFCLPFRKGILIFDGGLDFELPQEALIDAHHEHFRQVCLALKDADINLDFSACIFDAEAALKVGFQLDGMNGGAALVIDLMDGGDDDEDDSDDDDEDDEATEATLNALVGRNTVEAQ